MTAPVRSSVADIDLDAVEANVRAIRARSGVGLFAVVKADAYGHGAEAVAEAAIEAGADGLAIATVEEGLILRRAGRREPILVLLGASDPAELDAAVRERLGLTVWDVASARAIAAAARAERTTAAVHFKVDTGLTRLGAPLAEAPDRYRAIRVLEGIAVEGIFTHLARADEADLASANGQLDRFDEVLAAIDAPRWVHTGATASVESLPTRRGVTAVRVGLGLYGLHAAGGAAGPQLRPALVWRSRILRVADVPRGTGVGYGHEYRLPRDGRIATIPAGYGDGIPRAAAGRGRVLVAGRPLPLAGRVSMDHVTVDVTDSGPVHEGDEAVIVGTQGGAALTADDLAAACGTINYEIVTGIRARVPRRYLRGGRVVALKTLADGFVRC